MATDKFQKLQDMSDSDLQIELTETRTQYQRLKFDHAIKGLENPIGLREVRRDIARLSGEVRKREVTQMTEAQVAGRSRIRERRRKS
ncbi:MAG: 50S ribosomal protein L29 [Bacteroidetes bacterium]|nr:MAG: 50S ribosomal protein L29 [Bacteroidota bacterium]